MRGGGKVRGGGGVRGGAREEFNGRMAVWGSDGGGGGGGGGRYGRGGGRNGDKGEREWGGCSEGEGWLISRKGVCEGERGGEDLLSGELGGVDGGEARDG